MADEPVVPTAAPVATTPAASPAPVVPTPAPAPEPVAPAPEPAPAPAEVAPAPAEPAAAPTEAAPVESAAAEVPDPSKTPTLLEEAGKPEGEAKPGEVKPADALKPVEAAKATFEPYKLPEGVTVDQSRVGEFNDVLGKGLPPQELGQSLMDMHVAELQRYDQHLRAEQNRVFSKTRATWQKDIMADPELGGAGYKTTLTAGAKMRDLFVSRHSPGTDGYKADVDNFNTFLRTTGAGDHPAFWRLLNNVARRFDEPSAPPGNYKPPPDIGRRPGQKGRVGTLYDHPSSHQNRG